MREQSARILFTASPKPSTVTIYWLDDTQVGGAPPGRYVVGRTIVFSSGNRYRIIAVDPEAQTVTFARPDDPEDSTTETIADLDAVDVRVVGAPQAGEVTR